ncbi:MAG: DegV family EDD domain-containing protein [Gemmatimonadetes bacterium]|nr:DegV family EDD domain-containing protein [Gemmatimonadota bacterium]
MTVPSVAIAYLDGERMRRSLLAAADWVEIGREDLNRINVFPVPDGDTGTNFSATLRAVANSVRLLHKPDLPTVTRAMADACVFSARGNSGMLLSQFLLGFHYSIGDKRVASAEEVAKALRNGADQLFASLDDPVEGTILTVCRDTASAAEEVSTDTHNVAELMHRILESARSSLNRTPELLEVLKIAGVVDAGAKGFVRLLEGIVRLIDGMPIQLEQSATYSKPAAAARAVVASEQDFQYCTEFLVRSSSLPTATEARHQLRKFGGSLVVLCNEDLLKVHIHTDTPDDVFELAETWGPLEFSKADDMREQHQALHETDAGMSIVVDSSCDLPDEIIDGLGIIMVPLQVVEGEKTYRDRIDPETKRIYESMRNGAIFTTSQPTPGSFAEAFSEASSSSNSVLSLSLSSALSGTMASAQAAGRNLGIRDLTFFDSRSVSLGLGLLVLKAAELAREGLDAKSIVAKLERIRERSGGLFTVDRFDNLLRSGRVSRGKAWIGGLLDIKPILELSNEGRIEPLDRVRGRDAVMARFLEHLEERLTPVPRQLRVGIAHGDAPEIAKELETEIVARFAPREIVTGQVTPAIGVHVGPGCWGVFYQIEDETE